MLRPPRPSRFIEHLPEHASYSASPFSSSACLSSAKHDISLATSLAETTAYQSHFPLSHPLLSPDSIASPRVHIHQRATTTTTTAPSTSTSPYSPPYPSPQPPAIRDPQPIADGRYISEVSREPLSSSSPPSRRSGLVWTTSARHVSAFAGDPTGVTPTSSQPRSFGTVLDASIAGIAAGPVTVAVSEVDEVVVGAGLCAKG